MEALGAALKTLRGKRRQEDVCRACGISQAALSHYETGRRRPSVERLLELLEHYEVPRGRWPSVIALLDGEGE